MSQRDGLVLLVDDDPFVLGATKELLIGYGFSVEGCNDAALALEKIGNGGYDVVLSDIKMPGMTGLELLENIHRKEREVPVILMTGYAELDGAINAVKEGAFDFIIKPYKPDYLVHTIERALNHYRLVLVERDYKRRLEEEVKLRTLELSDALTAVKDMSKELIHRLTFIAEFRDTDTGAHIKRIGLYSAVIAEELKMPVDFIEMIMFASPMHDIGKIGIQDNILLKPGALTADEFRVMRTHTLIGERMLADSPFPGIGMAASVALTHHERWDGSGYPRGLKGTDIPIEGRIVMIVDQYDALRSKRPYKAPFSHKDALKILTEGDDRTSPDYFDPDVLEAFLEVSGKCDDIFKYHKD